MKRSFLTVLAASSLLVLGACSADDNSETTNAGDTTTVVTPAPTPMPDSGAMATMDTTHADTTKTTTTGL